MYFGYSTLTPYVPALVILGSILNVDPYDTLSMTISWIFLILSIPVYYGLFVYRNQEIVYKKDF